MKIPQSSKAPNWLQKLKFTNKPLEYLDHAMEQNFALFHAPIIGNNITLLLASHPQAIQQIFVNEAKEFSAPGNSYLRPLVGDYSLFCLEGSSHQRQRKLLLPNFHGDRAPHATS